MAIKVPIVSDFDARGIDKARRELAKLETAGAKAGYAIQAAAKPAAIALGGLAVVGGLAVNAAAADAAQQAELARQLEVTVGATESQVAAVEDYIAATEAAAAVSDAELRPAFANLARATGDVASAQDMLALALDVSAGTGKDLQTVSEALSEAVQGNAGPLKELDRSLTAMVDAGGDADDVLDALAKNFKGASGKQADSLTGRMEGLEIAMANAKEEIGYALLPIMESLLPIVESLAGWIGENTGLVTGLGIAAGILAGAVLLVNGAMAAWNAITTAATAVTAAFNAVMALNPFVAIGIAIVAVVGTLVILEKKFGVVSAAWRAVRDVFMAAGEAIIGKVTAIATWFGDKFDGIRDAVAGVFDFITDAAKILFAPHIAAIRLIVDWFDYLKTAVVNKVSYLVDMVGWLAGGIKSAFGAAFNAVANIWNSTVGALSFTVPGWVPGLGGKGWSVPDIPLVELAAGGLAFGPTLAMVGDNPGAASDPEVIAPLSKLAGMMAPSSGPVTINVHMPPASDGEDVVRALTAYVRRFGAVPVLTSTDMIGA